MNRLRALELWLKAWWCDLREHRWTYRGDTARLCIRCGRRQWRPDRASKWQDERRAC